MHFGEIFKFGTGGGCKRKKEEKREKREQRKKGKTGQRFAARAISLDAVWTKQYTVSLTVLLNKDRKEWRQKDSLWCLYV